MSMIKLNARVHFGKQLRQERTRRGMTQTELAKVLGQSPSNISHFEKGDNTRGNGSIDTAIAYARGLGATELNFLL